MERITEGSSLESETEVLSEEATPLAAAPETAEPAATVEPSEVEPMAQDADDTSDDKGGVGRKEAPPSEPSEEEAAETALEHQQPRVRRPRAAIVAQNTRESILAALVLARERRHVVQFWVCRQDQLMDFFKTGATDLDENVDILVVGFSAQPVPNEVLQTVELYRGRIQWLDHHTWPVEDQELLRRALDEDSIAIVEGATSPLAAVMRIAERRSRFTDKLIDFAGHRLSENDMEKWGYRLAALIARLTKTTGDHRQAIVPILTGKLGTLDSVETVYAEEEEWLEAHDPRVVYFGGYQMVIVQVPEHLEAGEIARRSRIRTGCRLSLAIREGDETVLLTANEEKRYVNVQGIADHLGDSLAWAEVRPSGDRSAPLLVEDLARHPERLDLLIGEIARNKSVLHG